MWCSVDVRLPTAVVVLPRVRTAFPKVAVLFAKKLLGKVTATEVILALVYLPLVSVTLLSVPPGFQRWQL
jgi:hypothetical protein